MKWNRIFTVAAIVFILAFFFYLAMMNTPMPSLR
jgi:hypothetical protein